MTRGRKPPEPGGKPPEQSSRAQLDDARYRAAEEMYAAVQRSMAQPDDEARYLARQEIRAAVGSVAGSWATFELKIDFAALLLAGLDDVAMCLTAQIVGASRKLDAYIAVARFGGTNFLAELDEFAKATTALAERRNRIIHDPWLVFDREDANRFEVTARRTLRAQLVPMSLIDIRKCHSDILAHSEKFDEIGMRIMAEQLPLP